MDSDDVEAIRSLIDRQFRSMSWQAEGAPDEALFRGDFLLGAQLYPSAQPVMPQSLDAFMERMTQLSAASLRSFEEQVLGSSILVFGNVAVAVVACETIENGTEIGRTVEMMLLVKDEGRWRIAAQGWDKAAPGCPATADALMPVSSPARSDG